MIQLHFFFLLVFHHIYSIYFSERERINLFVGYICSRHVENVWLVTVFIVIHFKHHLENENALKSNNTLISRHRKFPEIVTSFLRVFYTSSKKSCFLECSEPNLLISGIVLYQSIIFCLTMTGCFNC